MRKILFIILAILAVASISAALWSTFFQQCNNERIPFSIAKGVSIDGCSVDGLEKDEINKLFDLAAEQLQIPPRQQRIHQDVYIVASRPGIGLNTAELKRRIANADAGMDVSVPYQLLIPPKQIDRPNLPIKQGAPGISAVGLMINVAWGEEYLEDIFGVLDRHEASATFFVLGGWAEKNEYFVKEMVERGHEVAAHGYVDRHPARMSQDALMMDLQENIRLLQNISDSSVTLYTPHYAEINENIISAARHNGLKTLLPTADTADWLYQSPSRMLDRVLPKTEDGIFILMHPTAATAEFLDQYLTEIDKQCLEGSTCSQIVFGTPHPPENPGEIFEQLKCSEEE